MWKILKVFLLGVIFVFGIIILSFWLNYSYFACLCAQNPENSSYFEDFDRESVFISQNKIFFEGGKSLLSKKEASEKQLVSITYRVLEGSQKQDYIFYINKGERAEDIALYLGGAEAAYGWFADLTLTQNYDFSIALEEDITVYAQKTLFFEGKGKSDCPVIIKDAGDLSLLAQISNLKCFERVFDVVSQSYTSLASVFSSFYFLTESDIEMQNWTPLFNVSGLPFCGVFEGGGKTLILKGGESNSCGLFGYISGCLIKNLVLDVDFTLAAGGAFYGGGIAAQSLDEVYIENITVKGGIKTSNSSASAGGFIGIGKGYLSIKNCKSEIELDALNNVGGFLGYFYPSPSAPRELDIDNCFFSGKIIVSKEKSKNIGGFVGYIYYGASSVCLNSCISVGDFDIAPFATCFGAMAGNYTTTLASKITLIDCANFSDIICQSGEKAGGLLGYIRCREIEISNCANYGKISCQSETLSTNCGGIVGYVDSACQNMRIENCLNYGEVGASGCGGAFAGYVFAGNGVLALYNCINAAKIEGILSSDVFIGKNNAKSVLYSGCFDLAQEKDFPSKECVNGLKNVYCQSGDEPLKADVFSAVWKYIFESYAATPDRVFLDFVKPLQDIEVCRYSYIYDPSLGADVLTFLERCAEVSFETNRANLALACQPSLYVIKVYWENEEGFDYIFFEAKYPLSDFELCLEQSGEPPVYFSDAQNIYNFNFWQQSGGLYSLYANNLSKEEGYSMSVTFNGAFLPPNGNEAYEFYIGQGGILTVKVFKGDITVKTVSIAFEAEFVLPGDMGTSGNPLLIESGEQLKNYINYTYGGKNAKGESAYFQLCKSIDFEGGIWLGLDNFYGVLDGNGFTISNFILKSGETNAAFITNLYGIIKNIAFENISCQTSDLYGSILCINIYANAAVYGVIFNNCNVYGGRNCLGLGILASRAAGGGSVNISDCAFNNCSANGYTNIGCAVGISQEGVNLYIEGVTAQNCEVIAEDLNAALLVACAQGGLSVQDCSIINCAVIADTAAAAVVACVQKGELIVSGVAINNCQISSIYSAGGVAAVVEGLKAQIAQVFIDSCVITEKGAQACGTSGVGGVLGYCAAPVSIIECGIFQSIFSSNALYGGVGGIVGVLNNRGEISYCINGAQVISYGIYADAAGISAYCGGEELFITNCANLALIQCFYGRGGGIASKALGDISVFNSYNSGKVTARKSDAVIVEIWGEIKLFNAFYLANCAPCALEGAFAFEQDGSVTMGAASENIFDLLYYYDCEWVMKEGFCYPLLNDFIFDFKYSVDENAISLKEKGASAFLKTQTAKDAMQHNFYIFLTETTAGKNYIIDFNLTFDCLLVYKNGKFLSEQYGKSFELLPLKANDFYFFAGITDSRIFFTVSVSFNLPFEYEIASSDDLLAYLQGLQKEGHFDTSLIDLSGKYTLCADIDLCDFKNVWTPLGSLQSPFCGNLEGNGFKIKNLQIVGEDYTGFFGYTKGAIIQNLRLQGVYVEGKSYVGGVAGSAQNCYVKNCYVSGSIYANGSYAGALIGYADAATIISGCAAGGEKDQASLYAYWADCGYIGGIVGCGGKFYDCVSCVSIYSQSAQYVGGIAGRVFDGAVLENCFAAGEIFAKNLLAPSLPYAGYLFGGTAGENITVTNCGILLTLCCDSAAQIEEIELFNAASYCELSLVPDGEGRITVIFQVIFCGFDVSPSAFESANYGGITARLKMKNGLYKFVSSFDKAQYVFKTYVDVICGALTSYIGKEFFTVEIDCDGNAIAEISCANDFEYLAWAINGGLPLTLITKEGEEHGYSPSEAKSLSVKLTVNIDLTAPRYAVIYDGKAVPCQENMQGSFVLNKVGGKKEGDIIYNFYGFGNTPFSGYGGSIFGQGHTLNVNINMQNSFAAGLIAFSSKGENEVCIKDITLSGSIKGGKYAGLIGFYHGRQECQLCFENVAVKACFEAENAASFIGAALSESPLKVKIKDCVTDANFNCNTAAAFAGKNLSGTDNLTFCFYGVNKDYTLLSYASQSFTVANGEVQRIIKLHYGNLQEEYCEVFTTNANSLSITLGSLTVAGETYFFEPVTLVFKKESVVKKEFYLLILCGSLSKTYDGNPVLALKEQNYLGSWKIAADEITVSGADAAQNINYDLSRLAVEGETPIIVCAQSFCVNINKAPVTLSFFTPSPLIYDGNAHIIEVDIDAGSFSDTLKYSLVYYLLTQNEPVKISGPPVNAASYRAEFVLNDGNFYIMGENFLDFDIEKKEIEVSFPLGYVKSKTWGSGDPLWETISFEVLLKNYSEIINISFLREEGESVGVYGVLPCSSNGNYEIKLAENGYFEITKAPITLFFVVTSKVYDGKAANFTAFAQGVAGNTQPKGQITYSYYLDGALTVPTTLISAGAQSLGGAPIFAGRYFVKAQYGGDENYAAVTAAEEIIIEKATPFFTLPAVKEIYAGQSLFDSAFTGGSGEGNFSWKENRVLNIGGEFCALAVFTPADGRNYLCAEFEIFIKVSQLIVIFKDDIKTLEVGVLYGQSVDKTLYSPLPKLGYRAEWEDISTQNITDFIVVNAVYTLIAPQISIEGDSECVYGQTLMLNAVAFHPLDNLSYAWRKEGSEDTISASSVLTLNEVSQSGKYILTVSVKDGKNKALAQASVEVSIRRAYLDVKAYSYSGVYDGKSHSVAVDAPQDAKVQYSFDKVTWRDYAFSFKNACDFEVFFKVSKENYHDFVGSAFVKIDKRQISIAIDDKQGVYSAALLPLTYKITKGAVLDGDRLEVALTKENGTNVGCYAISGACSNENYIAEFSCGVYFITPFNLPLSNFNFCDSVKEYDGSAQKLCAEGLPDGIKAEYYCDSLCTKIFEGAKERGEYDVYAKISCPYGNYLFEGENTLTLYAKLTVVVKVELKWTVPQELVYCGGEMRSLVKACYVDEKGNTVAAPLTFTQQGEQCFFLNAGIYVVYASLGDFYISGSPLFKQIEIEKAKIDLTGVKFNDLTADFDNSVKKPEITGELAQGVSVKYFCNGEPFSGALQGGEYVITAHFSAGENYFTCQMTAKLTINRNVEAEEAFISGVSGIKAVYLSSYERLKELYKLYEEIIYKEGVKSAKQKLDAAAKDYGELVLRANRRSEQAQTFLEKLFSSPVFAASSFAAFSLTAFNFAKKRKRLL